MSKELNKFDKELRDKLDSFELPFDAADWSLMDDKLNEQLLATGEGDAINFDQTIKDKLDNYQVPFKETEWFFMDAALNEDASLETFDKNIKDTLSNYQTPYQAADWSLMEAKLDEQEEGSGTLVPLFASLWYKRVGVAAIAMLLLTFSLVHKVYNTDNYAYKPIKKPLAKTNVPIAALGDKGETDVGKTTPEAVDKSGKPLPSLTASTKFEQEAAAKVQPPHLNNPISSNFYKTTANKQTNTLYNNPTTSTSKNTSASNIKEATTTIAVTNNLPSNALQTIANSKTTTQAIATNTNATTNINLKPNVQEETSAFESVSHTETPFPHTLGQNTAASSIDAAKTGQLSNQQSPLRATTSLQSKQANFMASLPASLINNADIELPVKKLATLNSKPSAKMVKMPKTPLTMSIGVHAAADVNWLNIHWTEAGYTTGLSYSLMFSKLFGVETGVYFSHKNFTTDRIRQENQTSSAITSLWEDAEVNYINGKVFTTQGRFIEIPLLAKVHFAPSQKINPYLAIGPAVWMGVGPQFLSYQRVESSHSSSSSDDVAVNQRNPEQVFVNQRDPDALIEYVATVDGGNQQVDYVKTEEFYRVSVNTNPVHGYRVKGKNYYDIVNLRLGLQASIAKKLNIRVEGQMKTSIKEHNLNYVSLKGVPVVNNRFRSISMQIGLLYNL